MARVYWEIQFEPEYRLSFNKGFAGGHRDESTERSDKSGPAPRNGFFWAGVQHWCWDSSHKIQRTSNCQGPQCLWDHKPHRGLLYSTLCFEGDKHISYFSNLQTPYGISICFKKILIRALVSPTNQALMDSSDSPKISAWLLRPYTGIGKREVMWAHRDQRQANLYINAK